ncbi:MAG: ATP-binding protein, partial [Anaerolineales bacterium]|nr:ATP-binding protein [Anaerolineales bacterium]
MLIAVYEHPQYSVVPFILWGGSMISIWLRETNFRVALVCLIGALIAAIAFQKLAFPASAAQYFFPVVVVVSSLLVSSTNVFVVAGIACAVLLAVARVRGVDWLDEQVIAPVLLTLMTGCAAWIGSRQMHLALDWMRNSYTRANTLLGQLRNERASLASTLKMLEDAYVRIEKMNYALIEAQSAAEAARRAKAEFAANVSHELRTPINVIIGFSETMANAPETYAGATWSPELSADIEQVYQSSRHLAALIDDVLDLSALDARKLGLTVTATDVRAVLDDAVSVVNNLYRAKNLELKIDVAPDLPNVQIDAVRIRQVLINLLTNASRFTRAGGVTLSACQINEAIRVAVADTGIGIAPKNVSKVFEDFGQVDGSTTRQHGGTGLGVPLSKRLVELHGGQMWLESRVGVGSTFYFTLPIAPPTFRVERVGSYPDPGARYRKALMVVESDPLLLRHLRRQLSGYDLIEVKQRAELTILAQQHQPIALLVDSGERAEWQADAPRDLPIVFIALPGGLQSAQALGIANFLLKPVSREEFLGAIAALARPLREVLVVDDDPQLVDLFSRMLQSAGEAYRPIRAFGGKDALARLRNQSVDLILLDLMMPEVDGLAVLRAIKEDPALAPIPVIVISAMYPETMEMARELFVQLTRTQSGTISETLSVVQALLGALPPRTPAGQVAPASPPASTDPPVS